MPRPSLRLILVIVLAVLLAALGYWGWRACREERARESLRELSVKLPAQRVTDPKTGQVLIRLDTESQRRAGIVVVPVERIRWQKRLRLTGFTVQVPHRVAELRSPWTGVVEPPPGGSSLTVGQTIQRGQLLGQLVVPWSPADRMQLENLRRETNRTLAETEAELSVARGTVERLRAVGAGAVAAKQRLEAEGNLARLEARAGAVQSQAQALQEALQPDQMALRFPLVARADGCVTAVHRRAGEVVAAGDLVATLYDPQELWIEAFAYPGELDVGAIPEQAEIRFPGFSQQVLVARRVPVAQPVDRQQQALPLVYRAANPAARLPVGLPADVQVGVGEPCDALVLPRSAVVMHDGARLVYLQTAAEDFAKHPVDVLEEDGVHAYVRPTLSADARVVQQGAQTLLSEEYKESIQLVEEGGAAEQAQEK